MPKCNTIGATRVTIVLLLSLLTFTFVGIHFYLFLAIEPQRPGVSTLALLTSFVSPTNKPPGSDNNNPTSSGSGTSQLTSTSATPAPSAPSDQSPSPLFSPEPLSDREPELKINLHWMAPFFTSSGYGSEAIEFVLSLDSRLPGRLSLRQFGDGETKGYKKGLPAKTQAILLRLATKRLTKVVSVCHSVPDSWYPAKARSARCPVAHSVYSIGRTMFETDKIPDGWAEKCNSMDEVWVPTEFHKDVFSTNGVLREKLVVIPESVDIEFFNPEKYEPMSLKDAELTTFKFLSIFKWEDRKGWKDLLRAYLTEFTSTEPVALYILTHKFGKAEPEKEYEEFLGVEKFNISTTLPRVYLMNQDMAAHLLPSLYKAVNAFVIPSRGEGWGRPHVEAMAMELPLIATNWSGPTAFMNENNSYPLEIDGLENSTLVEGHKWAKPSHTHLRKLMRYLYQNPEEAKEKGIEARKTMVESFSPKAVADIVAQQLLKVQKIVDERSKT
jgi:glycosyltransferase involved in cell wall biosynthesis